MGFVWDAKNNFILLHSIHRQQEFLSSTIDWLAITRDIRLEISSTPILLQNQYEYLLDNFHLENDPESLWKISKRLFLHSLCQQIEENIKSTLEVAYEFIRHIRAKRIDYNDLEQLIQQCNSSSFDTTEPITHHRDSSTRKDLLNILNRLRDYTIRSLNNSRPVQSSDGNNSSEMILEEIDEMDSGNNQSDTNEREVSPVNYRRRSRSLSILEVDQKHQVNIGVEWFVPKFRRQQRSSSLHDRSQSPILINSVTSQTTHLQSERTVITTISSDECSNSQLRQTHTESESTNEQIAEKERQFQSLHLQDLEQVSSTDSDSIEIEQPVSTKKKTSSADDPHQHDENSCKRQRIADED